MEELKEPKKVFSRLGFCYIAGTAVMYILQLAAGILLQKYQPAWADSMGFTLLLSGFTVYVCSMPLIVLLTRGMKKDTIERHKMTWWQFVLALIICYSLVYASNMIGVFITTYIGLFKGSSVENNLVGFVTEGNMLINFLLMVVVAPIVEEYVFRKVIVDRTVRYGQGIAIAASGLMFGLFHGNLNQFAYAVVLGAFFAFLYIKTGNLKITIAMHAIINFMGSMVAGQLLKLLNYDELAEISASMDSELIMQYFIDNLGVWILFMAYAFLLFAVVMGGFILFIFALIKKKFALEPGREQIPRGQVFNTLIVNPGMLTFCVIWVVLIVLQLLA